MYKSITWGRAATIGDPIVLKYTHSKQVTFIQLYSGPFLPPSLPLSPFFLPHAFLPTDSNESGRVHRARRADTNILVVKFNTLTGPSHVHTGDAVLCGNDSCTAILSHLSRVTDHKDPQKDEKVRVHSAQLKPSDILTSSTCTCTCHCGNHLFNTPPLSPEACIRTLYVCTHIHVHCMYMYIHVYVHVHTCVCTCIYKQTHTQLYSRARCTLLRSLSFACTV